MFEQQKHISHSTSININYDHFFIYANCFVKLGYPKYVDIFYNVDENMIAIKPLQDEGSWSYYVGIGRKIYCSEVLNQFGFTVPTGEYSGEWNEAKQWLEIKL